MLQICFGTSEFGSLSHLCDAKTGSKLVSSKSEINSSCHEKM